MTSTSGIGGPINSREPSRNISHIASMNDFSHLYATEKRHVMGPLIVHQNANLHSSESEIMQLYAKAKCIIPAVRNYLFFSSSQVAVVYFGKRMDEKGRKIGIAEGAEDFKVKMIRYLTAEIWPPLLRTDAPDESLGTDIMDSQGCNDTFASEPGSPSTARCRQRAEDMQEQEWFKKSLESAMEVLVYLKKASQQTKYMKVILHNNTQRIHFDIIDYREEKFRWELRKLFTRIMDNLESQKAVDSYESYHSCFRAACEMAAQHSMELVRPTQRMVRAIVWSLPYQEKRVDSEATPSSPTRELDLRHWEISSSQPSPLPRTSSSLWDNGWKGTNDVFSGLSTPPSAFFSAAPAPANFSPAGTTPFSSPPTPSLPPPIRHTVEYQTSTERFYNWMESLEKPESATLDYKSYMSRPAEEIMARSVKFMCGFLNAYREGKLVIGVHEISRRSVTPKAPISKREGKNLILLHNDLVDQYVVGVRMTERELEKVQREVSEQLLNCVPPIPPRAMRLDVVPIQFPPNIAFSKRLLILYDLHPSPFTTQDAIKQKCNSAVRFLTPLGLSVIPFDLGEALLRELVLSSVEDWDSGDGDLSEASLEAFLVASITDPTAVESDAWEEVVMKTLTGSGKRCSFLIVDCPAQKQQIAPPNLYIVEVSIDIKQCGYAPLIHYKGKFFSGWPSIPLWDPTSERVRRYERNYCLWDTKSAYTSRSSTPSSEVVAPFSPTSPPFSRDVTRGEAPPPSSSSYADPNEDSNAAERAGSGTPRSRGEKSEEKTSHISATPGEVVKEKRKRRRDFVWYKQRQIANRVLDFLYSSHSMEDILQFRLIHPLCNSVFENFQGTHIIKMIYRTPVGNPIIPMEWRQVSHLQRSLQLSGLPPMPLLLCRIYELMGNLPSPFPYVAVPMHQQTFRLSPDLIPLYYHQTYYDGHMRVAVVLDLRDSFVKLIHLRCGMLCLDTVAGVGFEPLTNYKAIVQLEKDKSLRLLAEYVNDQNTAGSGGVEGSVVSSHSSPRRRILVTNERWRDTSMMLYGGRGAGESGFHQAKREVEAEMPLLSFQFLGMMDCPLPMHEHASLEASFSTVTSGTTVVGEQPWTLFTLVNWVRSVMIDSKHTHTFGYCDRSFSFRFLRIEDICSAHLVPTIASRLKSEGVVFSSTENCLLHRRQAKWMDLA